MSGTQGTERTPEEIRRDIDATRAGLGEDLHEIEYKLDPGRIREQQTYRMKQGARNRVTRMKEAVMGPSDTQTSSRSGGVADTVSERGEQARQTCPTRPSRHASARRATPSPPAWSPSAAACS